MGIGKVAGLVLTRGAKLLQKSAKMLSKTDDVVANGVVKVSNGMKKVSTEGTSIFLKKAMEDGIITPEQCYALYRRGKSDGLIVPKAKTSKLGLFFEKLKTKKQAVQEQVKCKLQSAKNKTFEVVSSPIRKFIEKIKERQATKYTIHTYFDDAGNKISNETYRSGRKLSRNVYKPNGKIVSSTQYHPRTQNVIRTEGYEGSRRMVTTADKHGRRISNSLYDNDSLVQETQFNPRNGKVVKEIDNTGATMDTICYDKNGNVVSWNSKDKKPVGRFVEQNWEFTPKTGEAKLTELSSDGSDTVVHKLDATGKEVEKSATRLNGRFVYEYEPGTNKVTTFTEMHQGTKKPKEVMHNPQEKSIEKHVQATLAPRKNNFLTYSEIKITHAPIVEASKTITRPYHFLDQVS